MSTVHSTRTAPIRQPTGTPDAGKKLLETDRYTFTLSKGELLATDKTTGKTVRVWGDPHIQTGDGDRLQFQSGNVTIELDDGTKVTMKPTAKNASGVALLDSVAIINGKYGVEVTGVSSENGPSVGKIDKSGYALDRSYDDGTVLTTGDELDDLFSASTGKEFVGGDANGLWGEHGIDGLGGVSTIAGAQADYLADRYSAEFGAARRFQDRVNMIDQMTQHESDFGSWYSTLAKEDQDLVREVLDLSPGDTIPQKLDEMDMKGLLIEKQHATQERDYYLTMISEQSKASYDLLMAILRNFPGN